MPNRRGFTLVEILVVIGILAVLFAILLPVFLRAKASARRAVCVTQLEQIAKATRMYADDYERVIVPARTAVPGTGRGITWCVILQPYLRSEKILLCPDDPDPQPSAQSVCLPHSYGINYQLAFNSLWGPAPFVTSIAQVQRVSDIILFFDMPGTVAEMGSSYTSHRLSRVAFRHNDIGNFAYLDGHVKGLRKSAAGDIRAWDPFAG